MKANERACPRCAEAIKIDARVCKHCGAEFSAEEVEAAKKERTRKVTTGCLGCGGLLAVVAIVGAIISSGDDATTATSNNTAAISPSSEDGKQAFVAMYRDVLGSTTTCDQSFDRLSAAAKTGNALTMYEAAKAGHDSCGETASAIAGVSAPNGLSDQAEEQTNKALGLCRDAYIARQAGFEQAMKIADGDARPSAVLELKESAERGQAGVYACVANLAQAAMTAGLDLKDLRS